MSATEREREREQTNSQPMMLRPLKVIRVVIKLYMCSGHVDI
jgi:hypothetical protein